MDRFLMDELVRWKGSPRRKPLMLNGARQVGKTWLLKEFGKLHYGNVCYVSLDNNVGARSLFDSGYDTRRIILGLSLLTGQEVIPGETLIVLDEAQAVPKSITSLKYFCEDAPEYHVAVAGSLLGISATDGTGFPVGKVDTLDLYPLSFREFMDAVGASRLRELIDSGDTSLMGPLEGRLKALLKQYYVIGGMPAVVRDFAESGDYKEVRTMQGQILGDYERDFAKHVPKRILQNTAAAWSSIPAHLARENKKFVFGHIREGARAKQYEESLLWLQHAGLVTRVNRVSKPGLPLSAYDDHKSFKAFLLDVGLMGAMSELPPTAILEGNRVYTEFKGALTEQYVCQQLVSDCGCMPYYWSAGNSSGEIDFLVQSEGQTFAMEVKAEENLRAKSLRAFKNAHPEVNAVRFSLSDYREQEWMRNVPLYAMSNMALWSGRDE